MSHDDNIPSDEIFKEESEDTSTSEHVEESGVQNDSSPEPSKVQTEEPSTQDDNITGDIDPVVDIIGQLIEDTYDTIEHAKKQCAIELPTKSADTLSKYGSMLSRELETIADHLDNSTMTDEERLRTYAKFKKIRDDLDSMQRSYTINNEFNQNSFKDAVDKGYNLSSVDFIDTKVDPEALRDADVSKFDSAQMSVYLHMLEGNVRTIILPNSGLNITIKEPTYQHLNVLFNNIKDRFTSEILKYGAHFFTFQDISVMQAFWDFIRGLMLRSNYHSYKDEIKFSKAVSVHDVYNIVHSIACQLYPEGYKFTIACGENKCDHKETQVVDLNKFKLVNMDLLPESAREKLRKKQVTDQNIDQYRDDLNLVSTYRTNLYEFEFRVPSVYDFMDYGTQYMNDIHDIYDGKDISDLDEKDVETYIQMNYYRLFIPWISRVSLLDKTGKVVNNINETKHRLIILDHLQKKDDQHGLSLLKSIKQFISDTKITHICYSVQPCPKCNTMPSNAVNGYVTIDPMHYFFYQCLLYLMNRR